MTAGQIEKAVDLTKQRAYRHRAICSCGAFLWAYTSDDLGRITFAHLNDSYPSYLDGGPSHVVDPLPVKSGRFL